MAVLILPLLIALILALGDKIEIRSCNGKHSWQNGYCVRCYTKQEQP